MVQRMLAMRAAAWVVAAGLVSGACNGDDAGDPDAGDETADAGEGADGAGATENVELTFAARFGDEDAASDHDLLEDPRYGNPW